MVAPVTSRYGSNTAVNCAPLRATGMLTVMLSLFVTFLVKLDTVSYGKLAKLEPNMLSITDRNFVTAPALFVFFVDS